jgi:hypothetical protein
MRLGKAGLPNGPAIPACGQRPGQFSRPQSSNYATIYYGYDPAISGEA